MSAGRPVCSRTSAAKSSRATSASSRCSRSARRCSRSSARRSTGAGPSSGWGRARPPGAAGSLARRRLLRPHEPDPRRRHAPRPGADGLREGDPLGTRGGPRALALRRRDLRRQLGQELRSDREWRPLSATTTSCSACHALPTRRRSRRRFAGLARTCIRTSPRRLTRRNGFARSSRPTRFSPSRRRASSTTATGTQVSGAAASHLRASTSAASPTCSRRFFGDDVFGVAARPGALAGRTWLPG